MIADDEAVRRRCAFDGVTNAKALERASAGVAHPLCALCKRERAAQANEPELKNAIGKYDYQRHSAPESAKNHVGKRGQKAVARGGRQLLKIEQSQKIDRSKLAVPGWWRADTCADDKVGSE